MQNILASLKLDANQFQALKHIHDLLRARCAITLPSNVNAGLTEEVKHVQRIDAKIADLAPHVGPAIRILIDGEKQGLRMLSDEDQQLQAVRQSYFAMHPISMGAMSH